MTQPTVQQAVQIILGTITREQRRETLLHWRNEFGSEFASSVEAEVRRAWAKPEGRKKK